MHRRFTTILLLLIGSATFCSCQTEPPEPRLAVGTFFTVLGLDPLGEGAGGVGVRASYDFLRKGITISPELEYSYFPQDPDGNFGETQVLAGVKAGVQFDHHQFGVFLKGRPGFTRFGGGAFTSRNNGASTNFTLDAGGVFEFYATRGITLRLDVGDTIIYFPSPIPNPIGPAKSSGFYHNRQETLGISFRF